MRNQLSSKILAVAQDRLLLWAALFGSASGAAAQQNPNNPSGQPAPTSIQNNTLRDEQFAAGMGDAAERERMLRAAGQQTAPSFLPPMPVPVPLRSVSDLRDFAIQSGMIRAEEAMRPTSLTAAELVHMMLLQGVPAQHYMERDLISDMRFNRARREAQMQGLMNAAGRPQQNESAEAPVAGGEASAPAPTSAPSQASTDEKAQPEAAPVATKNVDTEKKAAEPLGGAPKATEAPGLVDGPNLTDAEKLQGVNLLKERGGQDVQVVDSDGKGNAVLHAVDENNMSHTFWLGKQGDGKLVLTEVYSDKDYVNGFAKGPELGFQRDKKTGKLEGGIGVGKAGVTIGEFGGNAWIINADGSAVGLNGSGKLAEISGGISAGIDKNTKQPSDLKPTVGVTVDGPGISVTGTYLTAPRCVDGQWVSDERGAGVSTGAGLLELGMNKGRLEVKAFGTGFSVQYSSRPLSTEGLDAATRARLDAACPKPANPYLPK